MKCNILVSKGSPISSVLGPYEMLMLANSLVDNEYKMELEIVAAEHILQATSDFEFKVTKSYKEIDKSDYVILAPLGRINSDALKFEPSLIAWLKEHYERGSRLISLCTGAFLLAETGLLDGKTATTHWQYDDVFIKKYPNVLLQSNEVICQQGKLFSSGGANAYQDLILNVIGDHFGKEIKVKCAKLLMLDFTRKSQQMYRTPDKVRRHLDEQVHMLQDWIQDHLAESFKLDVLAKKVFLSERQIKRKFVTAVGMAPLIYVQYMRVELAKDYLLETNWSVEKVSDAVGYQDVRFFRMLFKRHTSISPSQYRQTFT
jgi:transcriptional regulator GlxA family with amidase domain